MKVKLNLGCGNNKISDAINVDIDPKTGCDLVFDLTKPWPLKSDTFEEVYLFHIIEHIEKQFHNNIFSELYRVLKLNGTAYFSYPEFEKCALNFINNEKGMRDWWETTIFGRGLTIWDRHVCAMHTPDFKSRLVANGFEILSHATEPYADYYSILVVRKVNHLTYEEAL